MPHSRDRARMSATKLRARRTCCQGPHRLIMVVYVLLSHSFCSALSSGKALTQSNNCHALAYYTIHLSTLWLEEELAHGKNH